MSTRSRICTELAQQVVPLLGCDPGLDDHDLMACDAMVGNARVVAIGEATHGTSEFHHLRHRLVRYLVDHHAVRAIGLEAGWAECLALNQYVVDGTGNVADAVSATGYWMWDVWEFRQCVEWLRQHNEVRPREARVRIFGCDAPSGKVAAEVARSTLSSIDHSLVRTFASLWLLAEAMTPYEPVSPDTAERMVSELTTLRTLVADGEARSRPAGEEAPWRQVQYALMELEQVHARRTAPDVVSSWSVRDAALAANVLRELEAAPADVRLVVLAHNGHVARDSRGMFDLGVVTMGQHLAHTLGDAFVSVGMTFGEGAFQAMVDLDTQSPCLNEVRVGPPPQGSIEAALMEATPASSLVLDMRKASPYLRTWLEGPLVTREVGAGWEGELAMHTTIHPGSRHDVLTFVRHTTRAHPTPTGRRPRSD